MEQATDKKKSSPPAEDSAKLRNLKRYARTCGMHLKYVDIFADCKSMSQKERMLDKLIRDRTGLEGKKIISIAQSFFFLVKGQSRDYTCYLRIIEGLWAKTYQLRGFKS